MKMNLNRIEKVDKSLQQIEEKVKMDLESAVLSIGKIKAGRKTSRRFDEDFISELIKLKTKLATTKSKLNELGAKASNIFQVYAPLKRKSRSKNRIKITLKNVKLFVPLRGRQRFCERSPLV